MPSEVTKQTNKQTNKQKTNKVMRLVPEEQHLRQTSYFDIPMYTDASASEKRSKMCMSLGSYLM